MRIKKLAITFDLLKHTFSTGYTSPAYTITRDGLPADSVPCGVSLHDGVIYIDIASDEFPEVHQGDEIPLICPLFWELYS